MTSMMILLKMKLEMKMTSKKFFDDEDDIIEDIDPASQYEVGENDDI